jgi:hypothetical protein
MIENQVGALSNTGIEPVRSNRGDAFLLSRSTILVLSGVLLGMALRESVVTNVHLHGFYIGLTGLVAYLGLEVTSRRKHERELREAHDRMMSVLNTRIDKHVARTNVDPLAPPGAAGQ